MKFLKYITASLLLVVGLASCEMGIESGTVGTTTVQFANAVIEEGFGAGTIYIPLTITADTEEAMNSCNVTAKVKVVTTGEQYEGQADTNGLSGDYRITSLDVNFPAYGNYYDEKEPKKYYDEESGKWVKQAKMEVMILNDTPDELCFTLEIESSNTTIGENKQCKVVLVKTTRDRLCGKFRGTATIKDYDEKGAYFEEEITWPETVIAWDGEYKIFTITVFAEWEYPYPTYAYWAEGTETMYMYPADPMVMYDDTTMIYSGFFTTWTAEIAGRTFAEDVVILDYDIENGTITFPDDLYFSFVVCPFDPASYMPSGDMIGRFTSAYTGAVLTKK